MKVTDEGKLTAWERWELADLDSPAHKQQATRPGAKNQREPAVEMPTAEDVERILEAARREGFEAGYKEGQAKAADEAARLARAAGQLETALAGLDDAIAEELLQLGVELARQVVRGELKARPEALLEVVHEALAQLPQQHAAIHLNAEDAALLRTLAGEQLAHAGHRILDDARLGRGDCVIDVGGSHLDAKVATRWRRVLEGLGLADAWQPPAEDA